MIYILVTWDEDMSRVQAFDDVSDAIEQVKEVKPYFRTYLYMCGPDGTMEPMDTTVW